MSDDQNPNPEETLPESSEETKADESSPDGQKQQPQQESSQEDGSISVVQREYTDGVGDDDKRASLIRSRSKQQEEAQLRKALSMEGDALEIALRREKEEAAFNALPAEERGRRIQGRRKAKRKLLIQTAGTFAGFLFFSYVGYWLFKPSLLNYDQGAKYTVCKAFIELNSSFPGNIIYSAVEDAPKNSIRIWYGDTDAFGEFRMDRMRCYFRPVEESEIPQFGNIAGYAVDKIEHNKRQIDPARIKSLNRSVFAILSAGVDLDRPSNFPNSLRDLRFETDSFFRIQL